MSNSKKIENKIIIIGSFKMPKSGQHGGVYVASTTLSTELKNKGYEIVQLDTTLKDIKRTSVYKRIPNILIRQVKFIWSIFKHRNSNYLFVFLSGFNSYIDKSFSIKFARFLGVKIILFPRSGNIEKSLEKPRKKAIVEKTLSKAYKIICQCDYWCEVFGELKIDKDSLLVIENWIGHDKIQLSKNLCVENKTQTMNLICITRIEKDKGLIEIGDLKKILDRHPDLNIHFVGDGAYSSEYMEEITHSNLDNRIKILGWIKNEALISEISNNYDATLFLSRIEGYPNTLIDYVLSKKPIISVNTKLARSILNENAIYFDPTKIGTFNDALDYLKQNYSSRIELSQILYEEKIKQNVENQIKKILISIK